MQPAGRIQKYDIVAVLFGMHERCLCNFHRIALPLLENRNVQLRADRLQLFDGGGTINITRDEQRAFSLLAQICGQLCSVGRLASALEAAKHDHARQFGRDVDLLIVAAHERAELFINNLDHLLSRRKSFQNVRAGSALRHASGKAFDNFIADICLQKSHPDFLHGFLHIGSRQPSLAAQALENGS